MADGQSQIRYMVAWHNRERDLRELIRDAETDRALRAAGLITPGLAQRLRAGLASLGRLVGGWSVPAGGRLQVESST